MNPTESDPDLVAFLEADRDVLLQLIVRSVSHMIGTPLHVIGGHAALLARLEGADKSAGTISRKTEELAGALREMNQYSEAPTEASQKAPARDALEDSRRLVSAVSRDRGVDIVVEGNCSLHVEREAFRHAAVSLLLAVSRCRNTPSPLVVRLSTGEPVPPTTDTWLVTEGPKVIVDTPYPTGDLGPKLRRHPWLDGGVGDRRAEVGVAVAAALAKRAGGWVEIDASEKAAVLRLVWPGA